MNTNNVIAFRNPVQAALFESVVKPELVKGHWAGASPQGHGEDWKEAVPRVSNDEKKVGVAFEPRKSNYDLLNKDFVDSVATKAIKKVKSATGETLTPRQLRAELKDMMFIMRTPLGKPLAKSNQGLMTRPGRPSKMDLQALGQALKAKSGTTKTTTRKATTRTKRARAA